MKKLLLLIILAACVLCTFGQRPSDTAAHVKEFEKIMSFSTQPYVFYTTVSSLSSQPVLTPEDTAMATGIFCKNESNFYYATGADEVYLEDSLMVQVDHTRKTVWVSRMSADAKEKMGAMSMTNRQLQELLRSKYSIQKINTGARLCRLQFESRHASGNASIINSIVGLDYNEKDYIPLKIELELGMQQAVNDVIIAQIKNEGIREDLLLKIIDGKQWMVRKQKLSVLFSAVDYSKEKASEIPLYKNVLDYDPVSRQYTPKNRLAEYNLTQTF